MSIVRFSSDKDRSEVYVYGSEDSWVIHVAGARRLGVDHSIHPGPLPLQEDADIDAWAKQYQGWMKHLESCQMERIDGPHDGKTYTFDLDDADGVIQMLLQIREDGYHVPEPAIETMRGGQLCESP